MMDMVVKMWVGGGEIRILPRGTCGVCAAAPRTASHAWPTLTDLAKKIGCPPHPLHWGGRAI